ncbi:hypothetical protein PM082_021642 [Marasmius tenuissimus]|nr:hypothetical protein PM082_021642 [Marasmius tenuissimus]
MEIMISKTLSLLRGLCPTGPEETKTVTTRVSFLQHKGSAGRQTDPGRCGARDERVSNPLRRVPLMFSLHGKPLDGTRQKRTGGDELDDYSNYVHYNARVHSRELVIGPPKGISDACLHRKPFEWPANHRLLYHALARQGSNILWLLSRPTTPTRAATRGSALLVSMGGSSTTLNGGG